MGKICKSASASRSGRGQRGAFSTRASKGTRPVSLPVTLAPISRSEARGGWRSLECGVHKMGKICKSASASRSGRGQRGAFSTRASQGARPREATGAVGPYLALRSARRMAVSWMRCQRNGQLSRYTMFKGRCKSHSIVKEMGKICKSASASRSGRGQRGAFSTRASQGTRHREATGDVGPHLALRSARRMAVSWMRCQRNGQNLQKCVSFEKRARPAWGVFDTGKPGGTSP